MMTDRVSYSFTIELVIAFCITLVLTAPSPHSTDIGSLKQNVPSAPQIQNSPNSSNNSDPRKDGRNENIRILKTNEKHEQSQAEVNEEKELEQWEAKMRHITDERFNRWSKYAIEAPKIAVTSNQNRSNKQQQYKGLLHSSYNKLENPKPNYEHHTGNRRKSNVNQMLTNSENVRPAKSQDYAELLKQIDDENLKITKGQNPKVVNSLLNKNRRNKAKIMSNNNGNSKRTKGLIPIPATSVKIVSTNLPTLVSRSKFEDIHKPKLTPIVVESESTQDGKLLMKIAQMKSRVSNQDTGLYRSIISPPNSSNIFAPIFILSPSIWSVGSVETQNGGLKDMKKNLDEGGKNSNNVTKHSNSSSDSSTVKYVFN